MDETAVIGQEKQAGRVLIQPTHTLQSPLDELHGYKRKNTGMVLWLMGTFKACRLVQGDIQVLPV